MFYCDYCRAAWEWPRSLGWPVMGVSWGRCELCDNQDHCHDVPLAVLSRYKNKRMLKVKDCGECQQRRPHWVADYICVFCRGDIERPDPEADLKQANLEAKLRLEKKVQERLDRLM